MYPLALPVLRLNSSPNFIHRFFFIIMYLHNESEPYSFIVQFRCEWYVCHRLIQIHTQAQNRNVTVSSETDIYTEPYTIYLLLLHSFFPLFLSLSFSVCVSLFLHNRQFSKLIIV